MRLCACQFIPYNNCGFPNNIFEMKVAASCNAKLCNPDLIRKIWKYACFLYVFHETERVLLVKTANTGF